MMRLHTKKMVALLSIVSCICTGCSEKSGDGTAVGTAATEVTTEEATTTEQMAALSTEEVKSEEALFEEFVRGFLQNNYFYMPHIQAILGSISMKVENWR